MTLPLPALIKGKSIQENFDAVASQFPVQAPNMANKSVPDKALAKPVIAGAVKATGEKELGEGFTSTKTATGIYKIELTTELATTGSMTVTIVGGANNVARVVANAKKVFEVVTYTLAPVTADTAFNFMIKAS